MMRLIMRLNWVYLTFLIAVANVFAADDSQEKADDSKKPKAEKVTFLLGRAVDASMSSDDKWMAGVIEAVMEFKCAAIDGFVLVDQNELRKNVPAHHNLSKVPSESDYFDAAKKLKADYIGIQKFEISPRDKSVFYYMEIISVEKRKMLTTIEREFKLNSIGVALDEILDLLLKEFKLSTPRELARFIKLPAVGQDYKTLKQLGECILSERFSKGGDSAKIADEYRKVCEKDRSMLVGFYRAGHFFEAVGKPGDASEAFNILFLALPEYYPVYIPLCRNFRKSRRFEDAVRIAMLGEQRGIKHAELISEKALAYEGMGKKADAENAYKQILAVDPEDPYALLFYARKNNDDGKAKEALGYSERLIKGNKELGPAYMEYGRSLMLLSKTEEAIQALTKAKENMGGAPEPSIYLGDLYISLKKFAKALQCYEEVLKRAPDNVDLHLKAASASEQAGDPKKALAILKQIESRFSNHGGLQKELGVLSLINGDTTKARVHLEASMRAGTEDERVLKGLGWIYLGAGDNDKAFTMFTKALTKAKDKNDCKLGLAMVYIKRGETKSALGLLEEIAAGGDLKIPGVNKMLGDAFLAKGDKPKALSHFKKERAISNADTSLQAQIASLSYELSSPQESKNEYKKLADMGAGGAKTLYMLGVLSLRLKDKPGAQKILSDAAKKGPADAETYFIIGKEYASLGDLEHAIQAYEDCVKKEPSREVAWVELAAILAKKGQDSSAAEAYLKLFSFDNEKYKTNLIEAARLFEKSGAKAKAKNTYSQFLAKKYSDPAVNVSLASLEFDEKNYKAVIALLENLSPSQINQKEARMLAESYCHTDQYEKAKVHLKYLLTKNPKDLKAIELSAQSYEKTGALGEAVSMYKKYLTYSGKHQEYAFKIAELYEKQKQTSSATTQYQSNITAYPDDFRNYDRLVRLYAESKAWKSVIPVLKKALQFKEASTELHGLMAKAMSETGNKSGAVESFKAYLEKADRDTAAWLELGSLYFEQKKYNEAIQTLSKASAMMGRNFDVFKMLGVSHVKSGDLQKAIDPLAKAHELDKGDIEVMDLLAKCYRETKSTRNLSSILLAWMRVDKKNYEIRTELADILLSESKAADAASMLEDAVRLKQCATELHLKLAQIYEKLGTNDRMYGHLRSALQCSPRNADVNFQVSRYYFGLKDYEKAEGYLRKTLELSSDHPSANFMLGTSLLAQRKYKDAVSSLSKSVKAEPDSISYRIALTEALYRTGDYEQALKVIKPAVMKDKAQAEALRWAGLLYKTNGKADTAKQILQYAILVNKSCSECFVALGDLYFDEADYREASKNYQIAMDQSGYNENAAVRLAQSYHRSGKSDQAMKIFSTILSNNPQNGEALYRMCHSYIQNNQIEMAKSTLSKQSGAKQGWHFLIDAEISEAEGNTNAAMIAYSKALKMMPEVSEVQAGCGRISFAKRKYTAAIMYFGQAMAGDPENVQLILDLGKSYEGSRDYSTAMELYQEVLRRQPNHPDVHYCMARIASRENDHAKAVEILLDGIRYNKKNALLYLALGHEYRIMKKEFEALDAYLKAVKTDEQKSKEAYKYIGNIYYMKKDEKKAKKYYEMYISVGGEDKRVNKLLEKLP